MTLVSTWDLDLDFDLETHDSWPHLDLKGRQFCKKDGWLLRPFSSISIQIPTQSIGNWQPENEI